MAGSSSAPSVLRPSPEAVESINRPSSPPDAELTEKFLGSYSRLKEWAKRNKLDAVASEAGGDTYDAVEERASEGGSVSKLDVAVHLLDFFGEIPWAKPVAKTLTKLYCLYTVRLRRRLLFSSSHAARRAHTIKGNAEDIKDLREVIEDLIGIIAGRIDQLHDEARADIEKLHKCAPLLFNSQIALLTRRGGQERE